MIGEDELLQVKHNYSTDLSESNLGIKEKLSSIYTNFLCRIKDLEIGRLSVWPHINASEVLVFLIVEDDLIEV